MSTIEARLCGYIKSIRYFSDAKNNLGASKNANLDPNNKCDIVRVVRGIGDDSSSSTVDAQCRGTAAVAKAFKTIPGPLSLPFFGTLWKYLPLIGEYNFNALDKIFVKKYEKYGPITRDELMPGVSLVSLCSPEDIELLMKSLHGLYPERRSHVALIKYRKAKPHVYNSAGLLASNGEEWWKIRSMFQKTLSSPRKAGVYVGITDSVVSDFVQRTKEVHCPRKGSNDVIDFAEDLSRLNLQLICIIAFDVKLNSFSSNEMAADSLSSRLIEATLTSNANTFANDATPEFILNNFETTTYKKFRKAQDYLEKVAIDFVTKKKAVYNEASMANKAEDKEPSLLETYLTNPEMDIKDIIGMSVDLLLAGIDTTTFSTSFALYHLARNQEAQRRLFEEAERLLPSPDDPVTAQVLGSATYLKACLKESLRINPIAAGIGRLAKKDVILSGYHVPEGTIITTCNHVISNLAEYFDSPEQFIPSRWLRAGDETAHRPAHPYASLPFGHGARMCIARRLAEQNMHITLLKLVRNFEIGWKGEDLGIETVLINKPNGPVNLTFSERTAK